MAAEAPAEAATRAAVVQDEMDIPSGSSTQAPPAPDPFRPVPPNEAVRIEALRALKILDTQHEEQFDSLGEW